MSFPLVSVVIPTHNRLELVARAIASVRIQDYPNLELVVVDDGSTDGTAETLADEDDITLVRLKESVGGAAARNRGIEASHGEFVAFLDSDDEWLPGKIEAQVPLLLKDESIGAVYCRHYDHDDETGVRTPAAARLYTGDITSELLAGRCPRTVSLFVVRRRALEEAGGFDETLRGFQDTDLWLRLAPRWHFDAVDDRLAVVHNHGASRITTDIDDREAALDSFLAKWGNEMVERMGATGLETYKQTHLAVAQGSVVLSKVRQGHRMDALRELGRYVKVAGFSNPRQLAGLVVACVAGGNAHTFLKRLRQQMGQ